MCIEIAVVLICVDESDWVASRTLNIPLRSNSFFLQFYDY